PAGEHTLQLLLADPRHVPHDPPVRSERIRIVVAPDAAPPAAALPATEPPAEAAPVREKRRVGKRHERADPPERKKPERAVRHRDEPPPERKKGRTVRRREEQRPARVERPRPASSSSASTGGPSSPCRVDLGYGRYEKC